MLGIIWGSSKHVNINLACKQITGIDLKKKRKKQSTPDLMKNENKRLVMISLVPGIAFHCQHGHHKKSSITFQHMLIITEKWMIMIKVIIRKGDRKRMFFRTLSLTIGRWGQKS